MNRSVPRSLNLPLRGGATMVALVAIALLGALFAAPAHAGANDLGSIDFPNSGARNAQKDFIHGMLLLHSFEYDDAIEAFQAARAQDPAFAMAYWGEALAQHHPIWQQEDIDEARAILNRLAPTPAARLEKCGNAVEKGLMEAVDILYADGARPERRQAYSDAMGRLHSRFPENQEIASFYSLSILGLTYGVRDVPSYMRAAGIAEKVYDMNPKHPGALHYLIHAYDDPVHAPLGLRQANLYARVAPAAAHALHMPSHIYFALGMWDESVASNIDSAAAADQRRARKGLSIEERGYHALFWLAYSRLQQGRITDATELLRQMVKDHEEAGASRTRYHLAAMKTAHVIATGDWEGEAARIAVDPEGLSLPATAAVRLVDGMRAAARGDMDAAREQLALLESAIDTVSEEEAEAVHAGCAPAADTYAATDPPGRQAAKVMAQELRGFVQFKAGEVGAALETLRTAAEHEDLMGFDFGPPTVVKPARELLGEVLLELGHADEAAAEFEAALQRAPRRSRTLLGLARAASGTGDIATATRVREELASIWHSADDGYAPLAELRSKGSLASR